jgi:hypothetical protein
LNTRLKYFLKGVVILVGVILVLYFALFIYVSTHKKAIIKQVTEEVGKELNGNVSIGDVDLSFFSTFPNLSVFLHKVVITDSLFAQHHHAFFTGDRVFAKLSISKLIKKESAIDGFKIENAAIYLYTDSTGYTNEYLFKPKKDSTSGKIKSAENNILKSIILKIVQFTINDKRNGKLHDIAIKNLNLKLNDLDSALLISAKADLLIHKLAFNVDAGSFVQEKTFEGNFHLRIDKKLQQLQFDSIDIRIEKHPFNLSGRFDLKGPNPQMQLKIHTRNILYAFAKTLLTSKIATALSIVDIDKKLDADVVISGPLKGGEPLILANWKVKNSHLSNPFFDFDDATFNGSFTNEVVKGLPRFDKNSEIELDHFSAKWNGLPVTSNHIEILNLYEPILTCDLQSNFPLAAINDILGSNTIELKSGNGVFNLTYKGPLEKNNNTNSFINGIITFSNGTLLYAPRDVEMKNVNGKLIIKNSDVLVENLQCMVLNNKFIMNGQANNLLTLMNTEPNKANIEWNIYSPSLNLSSFTYLLKTRKTISDYNSGKRKLSKIAGKIDAVLDQGSINVNLKANKLQYKKFEATDAVANISLLQDRYILNKVSMKQGGGSIDISGSLVNRKSNFHEAIIDATLTDVDVNKIFSAFNNFGQTGIEAPNIEGKLSAKVKASLGLDDNGNVYPASIASTVDFSLINGALLNFEPIKKLQNLLFKNRDFDNIQFAELKDRLDIYNQEIKINRMEIESSVLSIFVEGIYSMKGNTDIGIQVPLSNLKKRDGNYKPKNTGVNKDPGTSLYFRGRPGSDGNVQFKADLFNKFGKEKRKENEKVN